MEHMPLRKAVGAELRAARARRNWSQKQLAEASDLHPNTIARMEKGERPADLDQLAAVCGALGVKLSDVFDAALSGIE